MVAGSFDGNGRLSLEVAITVMAINAPRLRLWLGASSGWEARRGLYDAQTNITVNIGYVGNEKEGPSASACAVVALAVVLGNAKLVGRLGVTGIVDLRGRIRLIGGLMEKMEQAREQKLEIVVVPMVNLQILEEDGYKGWPNDLRDYAKRVTRGASNIVELLGHTIEG